MAVLRNGFLRPQAGVTFFFADGSYALGVEQQTIVFEDLGIYSILRSVTGDPARVTLHGNLYFRRGIGAHIRDLTIRGFEVPSRKGAITFEETRGRVTNCRVLGDRAQTESAAIASILSNVAIEKSTLGEAMLGILALDGGVVKVFSAYPSNHGRSVLFPAAAGNASEIYWQAMPPVWPGIREPFLDLGSGGCLFAGPPKTDIPKAKETAIRVLTEAEYAALPRKAENTLYVIVD